MDIVVIDSINAEIATIEDALLKIDSLIPKVSPDLKSTMATKKLILVMLSDLAILRQDITDYREGKAIKMVSPEQQLKIILDAFKQNPPPDYPNFSS